MGIVVTVKIKDDDVWLDFKDYVLAKHGKIHGALGEELTEAVRQYLRNEKGAHTHLSRSRLSRKALNEVPALKKAILEKVEPGGSIPKQMLEGIIRQVSRVMDRRAVNDRIGALIADGFLQREWELSMDGKVFRVVGVEADNIG
ncbi:MAG: hypothetical protein QXG58_06490 [Candidatus Bathyarchaeia archaeon]